MKVIGTDKTSGLPVWICVWKSKKAWAGRGERIEGCAREWTLRSVKSLPGVKLSPVKC
jgi:hypothetical protein